MLTFAAFLVTLVIALLVLNVFDAARRLGWVGPLMVMPASLAVAVFLSGLLAAAQYAPNENPDALALKAHAWSVAAMWAAHEERAVDGGACRPDLALTVGEDQAGIALAAWKRYAEGIDLR